RCRVKQGEPALYSGDRSLRLASDAHMGDASMGASGGEWKPHGYWYTCSDRQRAGTAPGHGKSPALRTVAPPYANQFRFQGTGITKNVLLQIPQFRLDDPPFHVIPQLWIAGFHSLLLQFRQHRDASLQSLRNMTHRNLLQAGARLPNSGRTAEFVTPIERARSWEGPEQELELGSQLDHGPPLLGTTVGAVPLGYWDWWLPSYFLAINFRCHATPTEVDGPRARGVIPYTGCSPRRLPRNA